MSPLVLMPSPVSSCFSNRAVWGQALSGCPPPLQSVDVAHGLVLLSGIGAGPFIMGFEDEVEQSYWRPSRLTDSGSKQTNELTSSIVPRGTSFHRSVELGLPPIAFDPARSSRCYNVLGPPEFGA